MSTGEATVRERPSGAAWVTDPAAGEKLARDWVHEHWAGRFVVTTSIHTALYRGPEDVSARVSVVLDRQAPTADALTLLVRARHGDLTVSAFPDDPDLPTLAALFSRAAVEPVLVDPLPGRATTGPLDDYRAEVAHHPREGACVLRLDLSAGGSEPVHRQVYAKVYPTAHDASAAADALAAVGAATVGSPRTGEVRLPRLLALSRPLHTTFLESLTPARVPGDTGSDAVSVAGPVGAVESARALRALHSHTPLGRLPSVTGTAQVSRVRAEQDLVATAWPEVAELVDAPLARAASVLEADAVGPFVLSHGDFTPSQLIRLPPGLGLVDLDTLCLAEAASDIGRFLAYHDVRAAARGSSPAAAADADTRATFLGAYGGPLAHRTDLDARVRAYRVLNLALLALRAVRRFKSSRADLALTLLHASHTTQGRLP